MSATRRLVLAAAAALPLALAACDNKCPTQNPQVSNVPATCTDMKAGATVTVKLGVCPRCDETYDSCTVTLPADTTSSQIQLDPLVQVCNADPSCPIHPSCNPVSCTFTAPAEGSYQLLVFDPLTNETITQPFNTAAAGAQTSCGG